MHRFYPYLRYIADAIYFNIALIFGLLEFQEYRNRKLYELNFKKLNGKKTVLNLFTVGLIDFLLEMIKMYNAENIYFFLLRKD